MEDGREDDEMKIDRKSKGDERWGKVMEKRRDG